MKLVFIMLFLGKECLGITLCGQGCGRFVASMDGFVGKLVPMAHICGLLGKQNCPMAHMLLDDLLCFACPIAQMLLDDLLCLPSATHVWLGRQEELCHRPDLVNDAAR